MPDCVDQPRCRCDLDAWVAVVGAGVALGDLFGRIWIIVDRATRRPGSRPLRRSAWFLVATLSGVKRSVSSEERVRAGAEWEARIAGARTVAEFNDLRSENDSVPGALTLRLALHQPSGRWLIELWMVRGYVEPEDLRAFAETVLRAVDAGQAVATRFESVPCSGDWMFVCVDVCREAGQLSLLAQVLDGSCGSLELERIYSDPSELIDGARALLAALDE